LRLASTVFKYRSGEASLAPTIDKYNLEQFVKRHKEAGKLIVKL